jgi:hypothetical protein
MSTFDPALASSEIERLETEIAKIRSGREGVPTLGHLVSVRLQRIDYLRAELAKRGLAC